MAADRTSCISKAHSLQGMGEYWDSHDLTEVDAGGPDVEFEIACAVPIKMVRSTAITTTRSSHIVRPARDGGGWEPSCQ